MRTIALGIMLAGYGIERAIRRIKFQDQEAFAQNEEVFFIICFFICLIFGW